MSLNPDRRLPGAVYFLLGLLLVFPLVDVWASVLPVDFWRVDWRFAVGRILSGFTLTPLLGWILIVGGVLVSGRKKLLRRLGWLNLALGVVIILLTLWHALDAVELWSSIAPGQRDAFMGSGIRSVGKFLSVAAVLLWMGVAVVGVPPELNVPEKEEKDRGGEMYLDHLEEG